MSEKNDKKTFENIRFLPVGEQEGQTVPCVICCMDRAGSYDLQRHLKKHEDFPGKITVEFDISDDEETAR